MQISRLSNPRMKVNQITYVSNNRINLGTHFKEVLANFLRKLPGYSLFPHRQSRQECQHFGLTLTPYLRESLEDKCMLFNHFYLM